MIPPICDINPDHGPMQAEHVYRLDGSIDERYPQYWFCQVKDCDGYGGPILKEKKIKTEKRDAQLSLFDK